MTDAQAAEQLRLNDPFLQHARIEDEAQWMAEQLTYTPWHALYARGCYEVRISIGQQPRDLPGLVLNGPARQAP